MSLFERISKEITQRRLSAGLVLITLTFLLFPFPIPIKVSSWTMDFYDELIDLPPGSTVIWGKTWGGVPPPRAGFTIIPCLMKFLMENEIRIIYASFADATPTNFYTFMIDYAHPEDYGYVYGEHWVVLPFVAGMETAMAAVANDLRVTEVDMWGTPLDELPVMDGLYTIADCDVAFIRSGFAEIHMFVRQWPIEHGITTLCTYCYSIIAPYYGVYVQGVLDTNRGYAEFEYMVGFPGEELLFFQIRNIIAPIIFVTIVIGNVADYYIKKKKYVEVRT